MRANTKIFAANRLLGPLQITECKTRRTLINFVRRCLSPKILARVHAFLLSQKIATISLLNRKADWQRKPNQQVLEVYWHGYYLGRCETLPSRCLTASKLTKWM